MEIKTKFNVGDTVYRIVDNSKLIKEIINNIQIDVYTNLRASVLYTTRSNITIGECLLYKDIEEIISNFKQQYTDINSIKE